MHRCYSLLFQVLILIVLLIVSTPVPGTEVEYLSPIAVLADPQGRYVYIAEHTANQVAIYDVEQAQIIQSIHLPARPTGLALSRDGQLLFITAHSNEGKGYALTYRAPSGEPIGSISAGHSPCSPVLSIDEELLFVCSRFENAILVINLSSETVVKKISVSREPVSAELSPDGKYLFVANHLHDGAATQDYISAKISVIDIDKQDVVNTILLPDGSVGLQDICFSPDGQFVYVTHILARYPLPTTQIERGWINTNALSIIAYSTLEYENTVLLDDVDLGAANPWGVACTEDGDAIVVSHAGTDEMSIIDRKALHERLKQANNRSRVTEHTDSAEKVKDDLSFLSGIRARIGLNGKGPRGLDVKGQNIFVAEYFSDSIGIVTLRPDRKPQVCSIPLGQERPIHQARLGEILFHDASLCFQQWQSCASCHPGDARVDGLNWDLLNDGIGNPKNVKSMLLSHKTPPAMISGVRDKAETAVRSGIKYILFAERPEEEADAIDAYLQSLQPVTSPYRIDGKLSDAAIRGQLIFQKSGCSSCHSAPYYTDLQSYDVGTGEGLDKELKMDTPTLIEVWRTAPYLHDGRAITMEDVFTKFNPDNKHGFTSHLSTEEMNQLIEFILSL